MKWKRLSSPTRPLLWSGIDFVTATCIQKPFQDILFTVLIKAGKNKTYVQKKEIFKKTEEKKPKKHTEKTHARD